MGFIVKGVKSVVKGVVGLATKAVGVILGPVVGIFKKKTAKTSANLRLTKDLTPEAYRKIVFGETACGLDQRFWEVWGRKGTKFDEIIACATHKINSFGALYFEDELAINRAGIVQSKYVGVVSRVTRDGSFNQTAIPTGSGTQWNAASTFDGVAHMKLAWTPTEKNLPNGVPNRYTQIVEGALVYDPRRDSTAGGSGTHRINDRTTWAYAPTDSNGVPIGRNNALQVLWYLLGWYIPNKQTGELILVAGRGIAPEDINIATFITAANNCEAAGYYTDMILSTEDEHTANEDKMTAGGLIGQLIDTGGLWSYYANVDDSANIAIELTDADVIQGGSVTWNEYQGINEQYQAVTGKFIDPHANALFQLNGYPMVRDVNYENLTGLKRRKTQDFEVVQDVMLAQKLARLLLNMGQYQAEFAAPFMYRVLRAQAWSIVRYTSERFGWQKLFRVYRYDITTDGGVELLLREIHPSIWTAGSVVQPAAPSAGIKYDPRQEIVATGIGWQASSITNMTTGTVQDAVIFYWSEPPPNAKYTEVRYRPTGSAYWLSVRPAKGDSFVNVAPINPGSTYEFQVRHVSIHEVEGPWMPEPAQQFVAGTSSRMPWDYVSDPAGTRPDDNADVTKDALEEAMRDVVGLSATEIYDTINIDIGNLAMEILRTETYRGETDLLTRMPDGTPVRQVIQVLSANYNGHQVFIASLQEVDGNGNAKAVNTINSDGVITGTSNVLTGGKSSYYIMANEFGFVDPGSPGSAVMVKPFYYVDGVLYADNMVIRKLDVDVITTRNVKLNQITKSVRFDDNWSAGLFYDQLVSSVKGTWTDFGQGTNKAKINVGVTVDGAEVTVSMMVNAERTGGNDDRFSYRIKRTNPDGSTTYVGDVLQAGMASSPGTINWIWTDNGLAAGDYVYTLQGRSDVGDGRFYGVKLIGEIGYR